MNAYERAHIRDILARNREIEAVIDRSVLDIAKRFRTVKGKRFAAAMKEMLDHLHDQFLNDGKDGIRNQWALAEKAAGAKIDGYLAGVKVAPGLAQSWRAPNVGALNAFIDRTEAGMNLSDRVWRITDGIGKSMEDLIKKGVLEGESAIKLSRELKQFIRGKPIQYGGTLIKGANINYQAIRLAATEMNMAFRTADYIQNSRLPFVTGVTVELSAAHPRPDLCDSLAGHYPKGFIFTQWHALCICIATYETMPPDEFARYLETGQIDRSRFTTDIPPNARQYLNENGARLQGYKNPPYFLRDNFNQNLTLKRSVHVGGMEKPIKMISETP